MTKPVIAPLAKEDLRTTVRFIARDKPLKEYRKSEGQLGFVADYEVFLGELDEVWER